MFLLSGCHFPSVSTMPMEAVDVRKPTQHEDRRITYDFDALRDQASIWNMIWAKNADEEKNRILCCHECGD